MVLVQKWPFFQLFFLGNIGQENVFYDILERKIAFLCYKNMKFEKSKNWHFSKWVNRWFLSKNGHFSNFFFLGNIGQENVFYDILERKNAFLSYENNKLKKSKNWHFSKGVNPWFWSKNGHFSKFLFLGNIGQENVFYDILERKNAFLSYENNKLKKSKNWHFSKGVNPWFWSKNGHFSKFLFLGNIGQENVFYDILERKNAFLSFKNKNFKKSKNWHFSKGVNPWFWFKTGHFSNFFFRQYRKENVFYDILERKNAFLSYKNMKFQKSNNWHFFEGVNPWFLSKNGHFSNFFFFMQYRSGKCLLRYSRTKKRLSKLWKQQVQKVEKLTFFQRG